MPFNSYHMYPRKAFTLIELLTVIAIIAILASMIFPSFSRAREMARRSSCASNMKQLGLGFIQYANDYDGRFPGAGQLQKWSAGNGHWVAGENNKQMCNSTGSYEVRAGDIRANVEGGALYTYIKSSQIYICPSNTDGQTKGLTYSMNCALGGAPVDNVSETPTELVLLVDEGHANDAYFWATDNANSSDHITKIHNETGNLLFLDGHVKAVPFGLFPMGDSKDDVNIRNAKVRTNVSPKFYEAASWKTQDFGFGSCDAPQGAPTPTPTP